MYIINNTVYAKLQVQFLLYMLHATSVYAPDGIF